MGQLGAVSPPYFFTAISDIAPRFDAYWRKTERILRMRRRAAGFVATLNRKRSVRANPSSLTKRAGSKRCIGAVTWVSTWKPFSLSRFFPLSRGQWPGPNPDRVGKRLVDLGLSFLVQVVRLQTQFVDAVAPAGLEQARGLSHYRLLVARGLHRQHGLTIDNGCRGPGQAGILCAAHQTTSSGPVQVTLHLLRCSLVPFDAGIGERISCQRLAGGHA